MPRFLNRINTSHKTDRYVLYCRLPTTAYMVGYYIYMSSIVCLHCTYNQIDVMARAANPTTYKCLNKYRKILFCMNFDFSHTHNPHNIQNTGKYNNKNIKNWKSFPFNNFRFWFNMGFWSHFIFLPLVLVAGAVSEHWVSGGCLWVRVKRIRCFRYLFFVLSFVSAIYYFILFDMLR